MPFDAENPNALRGDTVDSYPGGNNVGAAPPACFSPGVVSLLPSIHSSIDPLITCLVSISCNRRWDTLATTSSLDDEDDCPAPFFLTLLVPGPG